MISQKHRNDISDGPLIEIFEIKNVNVEDGRVKGANLIEILEFGHVGVDGMRVNGGAQGVDGQVVIQILEPIECESERNRDENVDQSDVDFLEVLVQNVLWDILGEYVNRIVGVKDLSDNQRSILNQMLDKQVSNLNVE